MIGGGGGNFVVESMVDRSEQSVGTVGCMRKRRYIARVHDYHVARREHRRMRPIPVLGKRKQELLYFLRARRSSEPSSRVRAVREGGQMYVECVWAHAYNIGMCTTPPAGRHKVEGLPSKVECFKSKPFRWRVAHSGNSTTHTLMNTARTDG